jgi:hypothetical protein
MLKFEHRLHALFFTSSIVLLEVLFAPQSHAQPFDFDYSGMVPFRASVSDGPLSELTIQSIYRNPLNPDTSRVKNGLPPVTTDSFIYEAGGMAEMIYGDEGSGSIPPYFNFTPEHRIEAGIVGTRSEGLTTGHSSPLPTTWGGDEFYMPEPFRCSGSSAAADTVNLPQ